MYFAQSYAVVFGSSLIGSIIDYGAHLEAWREQGDLAGLELTRRS